MRKFNSILKIIEKYKIVQDFINWAKQPYVPNYHKFIIEPIKLLLLFMPLMGALYQWLFLGYFDIDYLYASDLSDHLRALYRLALPLFYITFILVFFLSSFVLIIFKENIFGKKKELLNQDVLYSSFFLTIIEFFILFVYFESRLKTGYFPLLFVIIGCFFLANLFFIKGDKLIKNLGLGIYFIAIIIWIIKLSELDAIKVKANKHSYTIISRNDETILTEKDSCKYLIGNISKFYYIKDECSGNTISYPTSEIKAIRFKSVEK